MDCSSVTNRSDIKNENVRLLSLRPFQVPNVSFINNLVRLCTPQKAAKALSVKPTLSECVETSSHFFDLALRAFATKHVFYSCFPERREQTSAFLWFLGVPKYRFWIRTTDSLPPWLPLEDLVARELISHPRRPKTRQKNCGGSTGHTGAWRELGTRFSARSGGKRRRSPFAIVRSSEVPG